MAAENAPRDGNFVTTALFQIDGAARGQLMAGQIDQATGRVLVEAAGGGGTVTGVSVASANGFAGTSNADPTNPTLTLSTTVTANVLKGNGTAISGAVAGTDYQAPITLTTTGTSGAATLISNTLNIPNYTTSGGTPGGSTTQIQYNNAGAFGGLSTFTTDGTNVTMANNTNLNFAGGSGNSTALKTGTDGTFLFDTGANQNIKFKGTSGGGTSWGYTDGSFNYVFSSNSSGSTTQIGTITTGANGGTLGKVTFNGSTSGSTALQPAVAASGTLTLPAATDTLVGKATTDTFTNKTFNTAGTGNVFQINGTGITAVTGTGSVVLGTSPTITTSILAAANTANIGSTTTGWAHLYMTSGGILDFANGDYTLTHATGILTANKDFRVTTVGSNAASVPTLGSTSTLTNKTLTAPAMTTVAETGIGTADLLAPNNHAITVSTNAGSASQSFLVNTFTNSSAATMAITIPVTTPTPKDGQFLEVRIYDFSAVAQTIGWTNTENSTQSVPTTSNGSTTLPLSVLFQYNAATSKWRCIASA